MSNRHYSSRGQSLVELALVTPILLILLIGTADLARAFTAHIEIGNGAREGANFGSRTLEAAEDDASIRAAVLEETGEIFGTLPTVNSNVATDIYGFSFVEVTVTYQFEPIITLPGLPGEITLERSALMRVLE
jgi:Flp pilus assembly protein TadG